MRKTNSFFSQSLSSFITFVLSCILYFVAYYVSSASSNFARYLDEEVYISCGLEYVGGVAPIQCNFEHPPFAKYLIGFLSLFGVGRHAFLLLGVFTGFLIYLFARVYGYSLPGFIAGLLLVFDTIYFNTHRFLLLDPIAVFMAVSALYLYACGRLGLSAVFMGLAVASKFSSAPVLLGVLALLVFERRWREAVRYLLIALAVYLSTYVADLRLGWSTIIVHHIEMYRYMSWRHGFSPAIAVIGFMKLLARVEVWRQLGSINLVMSIVGSSVVSISNVFSPERGLYIDVFVGGGSVLWYLLFPALLYNTYKVLTGSNSSKFLYTVVLMSWLSLLNIVAGPLDWYYINVLPYLYLNLCLALQGLSGRRFRFVAIALALIQVSVFLATVFNLIPFKVVFIR